MTQQETAKLLALIKTAFPEFEISKEVIMLWHNFLAKVPASLAQRNTMEYIATARFAPRISDIIKDDVQPSIYEVQEQQLEQDILELQEYHEKEDVKPMPDHIRKRLERITGSEVGDRL